MSHDPPKTPRVPLAFAEALGGAIGGLWTTLLFFPIDVAKTRLQADADDTDNDDADAAARRGGASEATSAGDSPTVQRKPDRTYLHELKILCKEPSLWFAGVGPKAQLAVVSAFVYFYVYTSLKRLYSRATGRTLSFLPNLALASLAGVANVLITMPLDVVTTRIQVASRRARRPSFVEMVRTIYGNGLTKFWQGLLPALILTSNPAINYAAFDTLKGLASRGGRRRPTSKEVFLLGMLSKCIATLITYPLIRAKVIMMADIRQRQKQVKRSAGVDAQTDRPPPMEVEGRSIAQQPEGQLGAQKDEYGEQVEADVNGDLLKVLQVLVRDKGLAGLYVGVDAQVINTALKNAVLLQTKERVSRLTSLVLKYVDARHVL